MIIALGHRFETRRALRDADTGLARTDDPARSVVEGESGFRRRSVRFPPGITQTVRRQAPCGECHEAQCLLARRRARANSCESLSHMYGARWRRWPERARCEGLKHSANLVEHVFEWSSMAKSKDRKLPARARQHLRAPLFLVHAFLLRRHDHPAEENTARVVSNYNSSNAPQVAWATPAVRFDRCPTMCNRVVTSLSKVQAST